MAKKYPLATSNYKVKESDIKMLAKYSMQVGKSKTLTIPAPELTIIRWSSSDTQIATVTKKGKIVGKSSGEATVTATVALPSGITKELSCVVTVTD